MEISVHIKRLFLKKNLEAVKPHKLSPKPLTRGRKSQQSGFENILKCMNDEFEIRFDTSFESGETVII